ncbi:Protein FAM114A2 [Stylophora pistillata]|uniref:Protein FAM114A2 n=1 Tax=Stylophora pistillata TaxID=50429 RepID=A0A2B4RB47_STYPI|nr:Protein FAM114A2 [Stylophora pistillata]
MEKDSRDKTAEGGSSDEEDAFESADEGEEGTKHSKHSTRPVATSADIRSSHSTLKESVGTNDASTTRQVTSGGEINSENEELEKRNSNMDENVVLENIEVENLRKGKHGPTVTHSESSPSTENIVDEYPQATESSKTSEEDTNTRVSKSSDDEETAVVNEKEDNIKLDSEEPSDHGLTMEREQDYRQTTVNQADVLAKEKTEATGNSEEKQQTVATESNANDQVEDIKRDSISERPAQESSNTSTSGGWAWTGWGSAGWGSVLSQATASVTSGLSSVIETVETTLGVPDPEEMARKVKAEENLVKEKLAEEQSSGHLEESKGDTTSEGRSGWEEVILREAREATEQKATVEAQQTTPTVDLCGEFDKYQGLAHLEALEMLSRDSEAELESRIIDLTEDELNMVKPLLRAVEEVFHIDDENDADVEGAEEDFKSDVLDNVKSLNLPLTADKIVNSQEKSREWIASCVKEQDESPGSKDGFEIYNTAVSSLAELTARTVESFHKFTELLLHQAERAMETSSLVRAQCVRKLTDAVLEEISVLATHFAGCLNTAADDSENPDSVSSLITTLYLDSSTSADYLRNSMKLLRPVLQLSSLNEQNPPKS